MNNPFQRKTTKRPQDHVDVVIHDSVCVEIVSGSFKMTDRRYYQAPLGLVEVGLELVDSPVD